MYGKPLPKAVMIESAKHAEVAARLLTDVKRLIKSAGTLTPAEQGLYRTAIQEASELLCAATEAIWRQSAADRAAAEQEQEKSTALVQPKNGKSH